MTLDTVSKTVYQVRVVEIWGMQKLQPGVENQNIKYSEISVIKGVNSDVYQVFVSDCLGGSGFLKNKK